MFIDNIGEFPIRDTAHNNLAQALKIPKPYYDRMREQAPDLLAANLNRWLHQGIDREGPKTRLLRTLDGDLRAVLSNRYRPMDNFDLMSAVMPTIQQMSLRLISCEITETRLYIKALYPDVRHEVKVGDVIEAGLMVTNSEIGYKALTVAPFINRLVCSNGMVVNDAQLHRRHLGRLWENGDEPSEVFSDETRQQDDKALWMKVRDLVKATVSEETISGYMRKFVKSTEVELDSDLPKVIEVTGKMFGMSDTEQDLAMKHLLTGRDFTAWGLANAITAMAHHEDYDYDRSTEFETIGGKIIEAPQLFRSVA